MGNSYLRTSGFQKKIQITICRPPNVSIELKEGELLLYNVYLKKNKYLEYEIRDLESNAHVVIVPEKGGIVTSFNINGKELLYIDNEMFHESNNICAGGNPVLFPICGDLKEGRYTVEKADYHLEPHGFARMLPWEVLEIGNGETGFLTVGLKADSLTKKVYPYDFKIRFTYVLEKNSLYIKQEYINNSENEMPFYSGFHPFFNSKCKKNIKIDMNSSRYMDYNEGKIKEYKGCIDFEKGVDFVFYLNTFEKNRCCITGLDGEDRMSIEMSDQYKHIVVWTLPNSEFVCIEPWMASPDAMNTGDGLCRVAPGQSLTSWIKIIIEN